MLPNYKELPIHDFENDDSISEKRKEACKLNYTDMELHHIDKIYSSTYVYDKASGLPIAKKPKSLHELVYFLLKASQALTIEIDNLKRDNVGLNEKLERFKHQINSDAGKLE